VPAYTLPPNAEHVTVLRMVVKENFSRDMAELLASDVASELDAHHAGRTSHRHAPRRRPLC
jgi:glutamate decarboxylase